MLWCRVSDGGMCLWVRKLCRRDAYLLKHGMTWSKLSKEADRLWRFRLDVSPGSYPRDLKQDVALRERGGGNGITKELGKQ